MPVLTQPLGTRGFIGLASEATKGTPVAATTWTQLLDGESLTHEPGIVTQKLIRASRAVQSAPFVGEQKVAGKIPTLLYPDNLATFMLLAQAIGSDTWQNAAAVGTLVSIGASGSGLAAGSSAITVTTQTSTPIAANDYVEIHQGGIAVALGPTNLSEVHKVLSVTGAGPYVITLAAGETLVNTYTTAGSIGRVPSGTTAFTHNLYPDQPNASFYKTFTIEKNISIESLQYAGGVVNKASLTATTKDAVKIDYDVVAIVDSGAISASTPVFSSSTPYALSGYGINLFGASDTSVTSVSLDIDNGVKPFWTFNQSSMPNVAPPTMRQVKGKFTNIVQSDTYRANSVAGTTGSFAPSFTSGANSVTFTMPKCVITALTYALKVGDLVIYDASYDALLSESNGYDIIATVVTTTWLPFI